MFTYTFNFPSNFSRSEKKRTKLVILFSLVWLVQAIVSLVVNYFGANNALIQAGHVFDIVVVLFILILLFNYKYTVAIVLFMVLNVATILLFTNFIAPGKLGEFNYLLISPIMMVLTDKKILIYCSAFFSYLAFVLPNYYLNIYPEEFYPSPFSILILFLVYFFLVYFFKFNNIKSEKLLENKSLEMEELNKFQSQFFINISHEIRTPLTLLKGEIDKLKNKEEFASVENRMTIEANKIKKIVDDIIDLSKITSPDYNLNTNTIDLNSVISKVFLSFESLFKQKNISFELIRSNRALYISADAIFLERAVNNILSNALKYTDKGGKVILEITYTESQVCVMIKDTGIGISKQHIEKICQRFYQVPNDINLAGGSGVGLAFSKEIIELHNAELKIKSELNVGSVFKIQFPLLTDVNESSVATTTMEVEEVLPTNVTKKHSVNHCFLIVDDSIEMRNYLKELLCEYDCVEAENGQEALVILQSNSIDFIITDYMMPKMDGLEFVKKLKEQQSKIPILMLTAKTDLQSKLEVLKLGIGDYVNKPFEKEELLIRIKNLLSYQAKRKKYIEEKNISEEEEELTSEWIDQVKEYVYSECGNFEMNQLDLAIHFNLSKSSFYRKIKTETGLTPKEFITEIKLLKARSILETQEDISLKKLALEVGFLHASYFSKLFYNRFGVTPVQWKSERNNELKTGFKIPENDFKGFV